MSNVLIISPDEEWNLQVLQIIRHQGIVADSVQKGKAAQLKAANEKFQYVFLDIETTEHSGLEVLKFLRMACPQSKVLITAKNMQVLVDHELTEEKLLKLGASKVLVSPDPKSSMEYIYSLGRLKRWESIPAASEASADAGTAEAEIQDEKFTRIKIEELLSGVLAVTDFYIRISTNKYVKIIRSGETTSTTQLERYHSQGVKHLYFETKDRHVFLSHQTALAQELMKTKGNEAEIINAQKLACEKFTEEILAIGIQPELVEEGLTIWKTMYEQTCKSPDLKKLINDFEKFNPAAYSETFLVSFFSTIICKGLPWVGEKTAQTLSLGALLHDVGKLQLRQPILETDYQYLKPEEKLEYHDHTRLGVEALRKMPGMNSAIFTTILQHHEYSDGSGFPLGITSTKIFPMAKIICLADSFTEFLKNAELSAMDGLKEFLGTRENLQKHDPELIKNLIKGIKA